MAMMESNTNAVSGEKLLLETTLDDAKDSFHEAAAVKDVLTPDNVTSNALCQPVNSESFLPQNQPIDSEPFLLQNNVPNIELPESDAGNIELPESDADLNNDQFVNNCTSGHSTDDLVAAADEGFNEEKVLPSERSDDAAGTDQSSGIYSPNDMTPNSNEEPCHVTVVEIQSTADKIDSEEINDLHCSYAGNKSPVSNKKLCDTPVNDVLSPSRHSNVFELAFLQNVEKPDFSFSGDDAKRSPAASNPASERVALASSSVGGTEYLSERGAMKVSVNSLMSSERDIHSESFSRIQDCEQITSTVVAEDESNDTGRCSGDSFNKNLQDDAKLWCEAYVKLVDCANLLLLTIPSVIKVEGKSPKTPKAESVSTVKSISHSKNLKDPGPASIFERIAKSYGSDANSLCDDTDSHSDRGRKKRQRRSRKAPETKARKSQSKSPRRIFFSRCKASKKGSHAGDPEEVICKLDAWKKLHKSKAKANCSQSLSEHEVSVKQEPLDDFESLSIPTEYRFSSVLGDSGHAETKIELVTDTDVFTASHSGDQVSQLPLVELKKELKSEVTDYSFAVIKQEPADDYMYTDNCDTSNIDTDCVTPLFPIDNVVSLASVRIEVSGACYTLNEILQDDYWQPSVVLKRFPIWILQNLQRSAEGYV